MKKVLLFVAVASISALVACGPSEAEKQAAEKAKQDSIAAVEAAQAADAAAKEKAMADSTAAYGAAEEAKAKATADSIATAEASKKGGKGKTTVKPAAKPTTTAPAEQPKRNRTGKVN